MESIIVVSGSEIKDEDLVSVVSNMGGHWDSDPTLNHGVLQRGTSTVFCNSGKLACKEYSAEEIFEFSDRIGVVPKRVVAIDIGHGEGSVTLAMLLAEALVDKFGGIIDMNNVVD